MGRPSLYTSEIAAEICDRLSKGETLNQICASDHMPCRNTVVSWANEDRDGFSEKYARAREALLEFWADQVVTIADDGSNDYTTVQRGEETVEVVNSEHINRSRLRVDTRKWLLSKLLPKKFGDKLELAGNKDAPLGVVIQRFTPEPTK